MTPTVKQKYRPSVALILIAVNLTILALPLGSVLFFRIYEGRLVHETEAELISQAAVIAAAYKQALGRSFLRRPDLVEKLELNDEQQALLDEYLKEHESR